MKFERFTDRAKAVIAQSPEEAKALGHNYVGSEHLLLALLRTDGVAVYTLRHMLGVDVDDVIVAIKRSLDPNDDLKSKKKPRKKARRPRQITPQ